MYASNCSRIVDGERKMQLPDYVSILKVYVRKIAIAMINFDVWILINVRESARKVLQLLSFVAEIIVLMSFIVGLLSIYALPQLKLRLASYHDGEESIHGTIQSPNEALIGITDASSLRYAPKLEQEINRLKTKALGLEMAVRRMSSQLRTLHIRDQFKEDELADFASEAAGGTVLETPNTASYYETKSVLSLFGIPLCKPNYWTPRKVIQPWSEAGECWAFHGDRGNVKIQLAYPAIIEQVVLEHVSATGSLTGKVDSAPKEFRITAPTPKGSMSSGTFLYNHYGPSSQMFHITDDEFKDATIKIVTLEILSNWGNPNYTCVYRFKIHGRISL